MGGFQSQFVFDVTFPYILAVGNLCSLAVQEHRGILGERQTVQPDGLEVTFLEVRAVGFGERHHSIRRYLGGQFLSAGSDLDHRRSQS
jgi:hypothetical protein